MLLGIVLAVIAGALVSLQTIFNNKVNERTGSYYNNIGAGHRVLGFLTRESYF